MKKKRRGVSLIVLVVTIVVIIILSSTIIINFTQNNPIKEAKKAKFLSDIDTFKSELSMYELSKQEKRWEDMMRKDCMQMEKA